MRHGRFSLSSGGTSDILVDCSQVLRTREGFTLLRSILSYWLTFDCHAVGGPLCGSDPVAAAFMGSGRIERWFGVRKACKDRGLDTDEITGCLRPNDNVLLVEDVCTTGGNLIRVGDIVRKHGGKIQFLFSVVDRGGLQAAENHFQVPAGYLFTLDELK